MRIKFIITVMLAQLSYKAISQDKYSIVGTIQDEQGGPIAYSSVALLKAQDTSLVKVELSDDAGNFRYTHISSGTYLIRSSYLGLQDYFSTPFVINADTKLPIFTMRGDKNELDEIVVTGQRALVEIKPDRTTFNVQGTINSAGENAINLLRKAPGVVVDNNNGINILGRSGVLVYVDGKRLPLSTDELASYLENLTAEQIDKIDIISSPGSKYEAEGNAGIIDIRLKKDKNLGTNGSIATTISQGKLLQSNINISANHRSKKYNLFSNVGGLNNKTEFILDFENFQNDLLLKEININKNTNKGINGRLGADYYLSKNATLGFLVSAQSTNNDQTGDNSIHISKERDRNNIDSILIAFNTRDQKRSQFATNINYEYISKKNSLNIDLDYAAYNREAYNRQPNDYYSANRSSLLSSNLTFFNTPVDINIATAKIDYSLPLAKHKLDIGAKYSDVSTANTFLFFNWENNEKIQNNKRSNHFDYQENVTAFYTNMSGALSKNVQYTGGVRVEHTDANGNLIAFLPELQEPEVKFNYWSVFPSAGLTYTKDKNNMYTINYGRRINRPDYNVLNPFKEQLSELSYSRGNPYLNPEIVNNVEVGYTYASRYNFKIAYGKTNNQVTRLIGPDAEDDRANFISYDNLATQTLYSATATAPVAVTKWWSSLVNLSGVYTDNQANYNGAIVDIQVWNYNFFQQHTISLPKKWKAEASWRYSGPGLWGGTFVFKPNYAINIGIQKRFLKDKLNLRLAANDITYKSGWSGQSIFDGLKTVGSGRWDSRRGVCSVSYDFGNNAVKSRKRTTANEGELRRIGG
jgi:iron complex outermembrane recepter protein